MATSTEIGQAGAAAEIQGLNAELGDKAAHSERDFIALMIRADSLKSRVASSGRLIIATVGWILCAGVMAVFLMNQTTVPPEPALSIIGAWMWVIVGFHGNELLYRLDAYVTAERESTECQREIEALLAIGRQAVDKGGHA